MKSTAEFGQFLINLVKINEVEKVLLKLKKSIKIKKFNRNWKDYAGKLNVVGAKIVLCTKEVKSKVNCLA